MRTYLVFTGGKKEWVSGEVLSYDRTTQIMRVRNKDGFEYDRYFNPKSQYNRETYRIATTEDDHA